MQERLIGGGVAAAIFLPLLFIGGLPFQLLVGAMAMIAVSEMLRMKHLEMFSIEGVLSMLAAFILVVPIDHYFNSLPTDASVTGFAIISFLILAGTVLNSDHYSFDDAVYPITSAFYVGFGFQNFSWVAFGYNALTVGAGELVICYALGLPFAVFLLKTSLAKKIFLMRN